MAFADSGTGRVIVDSGQELPHGRLALLRSQSVRSPDNKLDLPTVVLSAACVAGDILGYSSGWKLALATVSSVIQGRLVALEGGASGATIRVATHCVVKGYTGATLGGVVYVEEGAAGNAGQVTQTLPSTTNDATTVIGIALSATTIQFFLNSRADALSA